MTNRGISSPPLTSSMGGAPLASSYASPALSSSLPRQYQDRLTVFQADPLVVRHVDGSLNPISGLDFEWEREMLEKSFRDAPIAIELVFDVATTERLSAFFAKGERILHFSCHGHEKFLVIENQLGSVQPLPPADLERWIRAGGGNLELVVVSACHSRSAGNAFIQAGVPHVVCCQQDDQKLRDVCAVEFEQAFYQALACGNPLCKAFDLAVQHVLVCPELPLAERQAAVDNFVLLPQDANHEVQIFHPSSRLNNTFHQRCTSSSLETIPIARRLPWPPQVFEGRRVDVYRLLNALKEARLVRVTGPSGVGLSSVTSAACHYIQKRYHSFPYQMLWLPASDLDQDSLCTSFKTLFEFLHSENSLESVHADSDYRACCERIVSYLNSEKYVVVFDTKRLCSSQCGCSKLVAFLSQLVRSTQYVKAIVLHHVGELTMEVPDVVERDIYLKPLSFDDTITLFGRLCQHVTERRYPGVGNHRDLQALLLPDNGPIDKPTSGRSREIFKMLGEGVPAQIHFAAKKMTEKDYDRLVSLGLREEKSHEFSSRAALDKRLAEIADAINTAVSKESFLDAQHYQELLDDLEVLKEALPDLETLTSLADATTVDLELSIQERDFITADRMKSQLESLNAKIKAEQDARAELGLEEDPVVSPCDTQDEMPVRTRAEITAELVQLEAEIQAASDANEFDEAIRIQGLMDVLKQERDSMPSIEVLLLQMSQLNEDLKVAKENRNWVLAREIHQRFKRTEKTLRAERESEEQLIGKLEADKRDMSLDITPGAVAVSATGSVADGASENEASSDDVASDKTAEELPVAMAVEVSEPAPKPKRPARRLHSLGEEALQAELRTVNSVSFASSGESEVQAEPHKEATNGDVTFDDSPVQAVDIVLPGMLKTEDEEEPEEEEEGSAASDEATCEVGGEFTKMKLTSTEDKPARSGSMPPQQQQERQRRTRGEPPRLSHPVQMSLSVTPKPSLPHPAHALPPDDTLSYPPSLSRPPTQSQVQSQPDGLEVEHANLAQVYSDHLEEILQERITSMTVPATRVEMVDDVNSRRGKRKGGIRNLFGMSKRR